MTLFDLIYTNQCLRLVNVTLPNQRFVQPRIGSFSGGDPVTICQLAEVALGLAAKWLTPWTEKGPRMSPLARTIRPKSSSRKLRPVVENLEGRLLMYATTPNKFAYGYGITFSIVPDGTVLGNQTSNLYATMDKNYGVNVWEHFVFDAAAMWESNANINLVYVADNGAPIGSGPYQEGNPAFGDIRIGGFAQDLYTMAFSFQPPPANGGSLSGDIFMNTALPWGGHDGYDLETSLVHEFGHSLGLAHSTDRNAAMYSTYTGYKIFPNQDDINGIQAMWGQRWVDNITQANANFTMDHAANVNPYMNPQNNQIAIQNLDIAKRGDAFWFKVTTPPNASTTLAAVVQSYNLSLLSPKVQIFDANGNGLAQNTAWLWNYGDFAATQITNATPNTTYYIRALASTNDVNGVGAYALFVNMGSGILTAFPRAYTVVATQPDQGGGTWGQTAPTPTAKQAPGTNDDFVQFGNAVVPGDKFSIAPALLNKPTPVVVPTKQHHSVPVAVHTKQHHPTHWAYSKQFTGSGKHHSAVSA